MSMMKKFFVLTILMVLSVSILGACSKERSKTYEGDMEREACINDIVL